MEATADATIAEGAWRPQWGISLILPGRQVTVRQQIAAASWFEQARGRERPAVDLPDDLLLAGVVLHDALSAPRVAHHSLVVWAGHLVR
jgi:hypothetical protein